ncbi:hypothetical protein T4D_6749 [Trichinella pseudospiralis]|uniref:Uncharacterized protein n=1 Tax=Trichinella pseudospiralis TaxID=6337 RepID=A0A0V1F7G2_TRIPS|nr:hypothetical protein T4D_6749 [Trichinella pseudospiralis]
MYSIRQHGGRVVKALDLRSNGHMSAWVRTPPVLIIIKICFALYFNNFLAKAFCKEQSNALIRKHVRQLFKFVCKISRSTIVTRSL